METIKKISSVVLLAAVTSTLLFTNCKKNKDASPTEEPTTPANTEKKYTLVIDNGAQSVEQGKTISFSAHLVSSTGAVVTAPSVSWSSSFGAFSGTNFSFNKDTTGTISASVTYDGVTYTAAVPICIQPLKSSQVFAVVPSAIIWSTNSGAIQLNTVYFGSGATYAFSSDNSSIASVSGSGSVSFHSPGSTNIKVTATINGQVNVVTVPVLVVGTPEAPLPVTRVVITPALGQMFKGETLQLNAKAYNSNGDDVTGTVSFNYTVIPKIEEDGVPTNAASVNGTGLVTAVDLGGCYVQASTNGVIGQAEIVVNPDTVILVTPFFTQLGGFDPITFQPNPTSQNFTAKTYKVDRNAYKAGSANFLTQITNPASLTWEVPTSGIPEIDNFFNIVTLSNANTTNVTATAIQGKAGSTVIVAKADGKYFGGAGVLVMP
ncbi:MAG: Ig protein [Bacteroidetes bacterium]|jgi:hypothetical protein|nr:Ig protein [Bacteroidota bacterium]